MAFKLDDIKRYDQTTKDIVFGFVRYIQKSFNKNQTSYQHTPPLIISILFFYYQTPEYFSVCGKQITLQNNNRSVECAQYLSSGNTVYGNVQINNNLTDNYIYIWKFKIEQFAKDLILKIGIDSSHKKFIDTSYVSKKNSNPFYTIQIHNGSACKFKNGKRFDHFISHYTNYQYDAFGELQIKMELNTKLRSLKYYINGQDKGIAFECIDFVPGPLSLRRIFVYSLLDTTTDEALHAVFSQYGELEEALIIKDKNNEMKSKGYGFVIYKYAHNAQNALKEPHKMIDGRTVHCSLAIDEQNNNNDNNTHNSQLNALNESYYMAVTIDDRCIITLTSFSQINI